MPKVANLLTRSKASQPGLESRVLAQLEETPSPVLPRIAMGESAAVSDCLDRYGSLVWALARRSLPDRQAAEDAVQEIFLKIWEVAGRFNAEIASEATFVAMIARRKLIDLNRRKKDPVRNAVEYESSDSEMIDAAYRAEIKDEAARALQLLEMLPPDQQRVIRMNVFDGIPHSRIAELTGLSLGTVKTHIRRGILRLRRELFPEPDYHGDELNNDPRSDAGAMDQ